MEAVMHHQHEFKLPPARRPNAGQHAQAASDYDQNAALPRAGFYWQWVADGSASKTDLWGNVGLLI